MARKSLQTRFFPVVVLLCFALSIPALARTWRISDYRATIGVSADGSSVISERLDIAFDGQFNGIHRTIPIQYPGPDGTNYTLFINVRAVTDGSGTPLKYESSIKGDFRSLKIYIPGAVDTTKTVQIDYSIRNATRFFPDHDEFYWNVTGNDWPVPIDHATAFVNFPANTAGSLRAQAFTGTYGSTTNRATANIDGSGIEFETTDPLPMRGGLTIDVYVPKGLLREPGSITKALWFLQSNVIMLLPFWALAVMGTLWWKFGRDPDPGISVAPLYEPPKGMTPAEVGTLVDDSLDPRDISSTLIDLAVKGYVKIEETEVKALLFTHKDYVFHLLKPRDQWSSLAAHELTMLTNVFADGDLCPLSYLTNRFYTSIPVIKNNVFSSLRSRGLYAGSSLSAPVYVLLGVVVIVAPFLLFALVSGPAALFSSPLLVLICGGLALLAVVLVGRRLGFTKTHEGARTRVAILGFQEFMNRVDADRLKQMPPNTFEKYLPYAMALGVEHHWARAFEGLITQPPTWYVSPNPMNIFSPTYFSNSMSSMAGEIHDVFTSAPRSDSSGSGFSAGGGGGFSGGGFGGGGGDAF